MNKKQYMYSDDFAIFETKNINVAKKIQKNLKRTCAKLYKNVEIEKQKNNSYRILLTLK